MFKRPMRARRVHRRLGAPSAPKSTAGQEQLKQLMQEQSAPLTPAAPLPDAVAAATPGDLDAALKAISEAVSGSQDLIVRRFRAGGRPAALVHLNGMVDKKLLGDEILRPLLTADLSDAADLLGRVDESIISLVSTERVGTVTDSLRGALEGKAALLIDGAPGSLLLCAQGWERRPVSEPTSEVSVRGPRESFTENLVTNVSLLRRRIRDASLVTEQVQIGVRTLTNVEIIYLGKLADAALVAETKARLSRIDIDGILDSSYIEQLIEDAPRSPFATVGYSERPDVIAARLLEGRIAIVVDGSPVALTVPYLFIEGLQVAEDYYLRPMIASASRVIRYLALFLTWTAPALYVAVVNFHPEMIPTPLLLTIATAREGLPLPLFLEMVLLVAAFEIIREAGIRLPKSVGQAVSIAGVIIVGDASVRAGFVGPAPVIVTALAAIASFTIEPLLDARYYVRLFLLVMSAIVGGLGIMLGLIVTLIHMASLRSFGVPYLAPVAPADTRSLIQDTLVRTHLTSMRRRPAALSPQNTTRQGSGR